MMRGRPWTLRCRVRFLLMMDLGARSHHAAERNELARQPTGPRGHTARLTYRNGEGRAVVLAQAYTARADRIRTRAQHGWARGTGR